MARSRLQAFDYDLDFSSIDFRQRPDLYRIGKGEQGVLLVEPYKSELLPLWRFRLPGIARESSQALLAKFEEYKREGDFAGMDMTRKFLQMGFTRSRRYANHRSGRKWTPDRKEVLPPDIDPLKAECAEIFHDAYVLVRDDEAYQRLKREHVERYP